MTPLLRVSHVRGSRSADAAGRIRGVVERVRTGRAAFRGRVALGAVIARMVAAGRAPPREPPKKPREQRFHWRRPAAQGAITPGQPVTAAPSKKATAIEPG